MIECFNLFPRHIFMALLSVIHTATVCWDVYKYSEGSETCDTRELRDREEPRSPA